MSGYRRGGCLSSAQGCGDVVSDESRVLCALNARDGRAAGQLDLQRPATATVRVLTPRWKRTQVPGGTRWNCGMAILGKLGTRYYACRPLRADLLDDFRPWCGVHSSPDRENHHLWRRAIDELSSKRRVFRLLRNRVVCCGYMTSVMRENKNVGPDGLVSSYNVLERTSVHVAREENHRMVIVHQPHHCGHAICIVQRRAIRQAATMSRQPPGNPWRHDLYADSIVLQRLGHLCPDRRHHVQTLFQRCILKRNLQFLPCIRILRCVGIDVHGSDLHMFALNQSGDPRNMVRISMGDNHLLDGVNLVRKQVLDQQNCILAVKNSADSTVLQQRTAAVPDIKDDQRGHFSGRAASRTCRKTAPQAGWRQG